MKKLIFYAIIAFAACSTPSKRPYVIMVSFDGFRHDYVQKYDLPNFKNFISNGASAEGLIPSFPSKTFPNHYTLVTGLYPGNHGLVDNQFFDRKQDKLYEMKNREMVEDTSFYGGTPLWQLAQQQGVPAASFFWVGSEAPVAGEFPDYYLKYDGSIPNEARIIQVVEWLALPEEKRPHFISLYFSLVDHEGHTTGPNSKELNRTVHQADSLLGMLLQKVKEINLPINIIVTSDHGMYELKQDSSTFIVLGKFLNLADKNFRVVNGGTQSHLYTNNPDSLFQKLKPLEEKFHFTVYKKEMFPAGWHYNNSRVGDLLLCAKPGYYITVTSSGIKMPMNGKAFGVHGYDPDSVSEMQGIFYAMGPNIKPGEKIPAFKNIHVYPLVAKILNLETPTVDGDVKVLENICQD